MPGFVLDASVALALVMPDEKRPMPATIFLLETEGAIAPLTWRLEIGNVLLKAQTRGRITAYFRIGAIEELMTLPVTFDGRTNERAWGEILNMAARLRLTTYDAAYLELAVREHLPIASLDERLRGAARRSEVPVLD